MLSTYDAETSAPFYEDYYRNQAGGGTSVFSGRPVMHGGGLGSLFGSIFRAVAPLVKKGAIVAGKHALKAGSGVLDDLGEGRKLGSAVKRRAKNAGLDVLADIGGSVENLFSTNRKGQPPKKRRKKKSSGLKGRGAGTTMRSGMASLL